MTPETTTTTRPQNDSGPGVPKTLAEAHEITRQLVAESNDILVEIRRAEDRIAAADFLGDDAELSRLELQREQAEARHLRLKRRAARLDMILPQLERADKLARAEAHRVAAEQLEQEARPLRRALRDALAAAFAAVVQLDGLQARHKEHAGGYSSIHEALGRTDHPNVFRREDLPADARMRDHRKGLAALWDVLATDTQHRSPGMLERALDAALLPYALPEAEEEEE